MRIIQIIRTLFSKTVHYLPKTRTLFSKTVHYFPNAFLLHSTVKHDHLPNISLQFINRNELTSLQKSYKLYTKKISRLLGLHAPLHVPFLLGVRNSVPQ